MSFQKAHYNKDNNTFEYKQFKYAVKDLKTNSLTAENGEIITNNPLNVGMNALKCRYIKDLEGNLCATAIDGTLLISGQSSATKGYVSVYLETDKTLLNGSDYIVGDVSTAFWSLLEDTNSNWKKDAMGSYYECDKTARLNISQYYQTNTTNKSMVLEVLKVSTNGEVGYFTSANVSSGYSHQGSIILKVEQGDKIYLQIRPTSNFTLARSFLVSSGDDINKYRGHFQITEL